MEKVKLALLGCGYLNEIVANALEDGYLPEYELVGVFGRNYEHTQAFAKRYNCKPCQTIEELMDTKPDFTAEAASVKAIQDYAEVVLNAGSNLVVLSIGAFANQELYSRVQQAARQSKRRVYIASGAVGGFDVLRTAALMSPITATFTSQKNPLTLYGSPLFTPDVLAMQPGERKNVFHGTTKQAIEMLPAHFNVAVATALASAGVADTMMNIDAVPGFAGDEYKIEIHGEEIHTDLNIYSRTSAIAGWSVVAVLQNAVSPIVF